MADCACLYDNMCLLLWQFVPVYIVICDCMYSGAIPAVLFPASQQKLLAFVQNLHPGDAHDGIIEHCRQYDACHQK